MDYKEKYEAALGWMQSLYDGLHGATKEDAEHYFPELLESKDESIRKTLIAFFRDWERTKNHCWNVNVSDIIAWLEKQGEKDKPKEWCAEDEQNLNVVLSFIPDECLRRWLKDKLCYDMKDILPYEVSRQVYQIAWDCGKTFEQSFALLTATHKAYQRGKKDAEKELKTLEDNKPKFNVGDYNNIGIHFWENQLETLPKTDIKNEIINYFKCQSNDEPSRKLIHDKWIAWLKKQGEKKPTDKVEPKFKIGDWIADKSGFAQQVLDFRSGVYTCTYNNFTTDCESNYHLWTINDAKDGDVLVCKGNIKDSNGIKYERICLFNNLDNAFFTLTKTSNYVEEYDIDVNIDYPDNTIPATKGQKEILFMAMKEAGYEWFADKKELKKIESTTLDANKIIEWLKTTINEVAENFGVYKETRLTLPYNSVEDLINDFKEDFGL